MEPTLLATKVQIPPQPRHLVQRPRLVEQLEQNVPDHQLTLLAATAGYGKTTLLSQWANSSHHAVGWLSLDEGDNDPERFLRYLFAAWEQIQPDIHESRLGLLLAYTPPDRDAVLSALINLANDIADDTVLVMDDYHRINDAAVHEILTFLLDNLPPTFHIVIASRGEPPLPLARYRARRQLLEMRADDLRFGSEETMEFLQQRMGLDLSPEESMRLQTQVEGWVAGLQLVALTLQRRAGRSEDTRTDGLVISGRHRFIADYLQEDVLAYLPVDLRQFLLQTSILERLCASLCNTVTGMDNGQTLLEGLERENLFLVPMDDRREWFRYHRLFADYLREELDRGDTGVVRTLHRRAARWYFENDLPDPALRHTVMGEDPELAMRIVDRYVNELLDARELRRIEGWIDLLPQEWVIVYPALSLARVALYAATGAIDEVVRCVQEAEARLTPVESEFERQQLARVTAVQCYIACMQNDLPRAERLAQTAFQELPEQDVDYRPRIRGALGDTYRRNGYWEKARASYMQTLDFTHLPAVRVQASHIYGALADLELRQGHLQAAGGYWRKALDSIQDQKNWGKLSLPVTGWVYTRMGELFYEWNQLEESETNTLRGLEWAQVGGDVRTLIAAIVILARLKLSRGDVETAAAYLEQARPLVEEASFIYWTSRFERCQLELWLAQDRLRAAVNWSDEMLDETVMRDRPESEVTQLAMARVLIFKGDVSAHERAMTFLSELLHKAEEEGRMGVATEASALQAIARWRQGEQTDAMTALERALRLAEPEGYIRLFVDLGLPMGRLLQEAQARDVMPEYVETLLAAYDGDLPDAPSTPSSLPEPLTPREQEVLELVAAGLTNREIGEELVISPETVKKHTSNIYGKLATSSRTEAVARARELNLL